jgi:hypothetical protein
MGGEQCPATCTAARMADGWLPLAKAYITQ